MANIVSWDDRGFPVVTSRRQRDDGRWLLYVEGGEVALATFKSTMDRQGLRRVCRDAEGRFCIVHAGKLWPLRKSDCVEVEALRDLFGEWVDTYDVRKKRGDAVEVRTKRKDTMPIPDVLTGAPGEVELVSHWPMTASQLWHMAGKPDDGKMTDCLVHLDKIKLGGTYNARRVRQHDGVTYIVAKGRNVPIGGELLERVNATRTRTYRSDDWAEREAAEQAELASERYDEKNVRGDETNA